MDLPQQPTVVLGSVQAALDLMEKRSHIYSDKPVFVMDELMTWDFNLGFMPYTQKWRDHRRAFHQYFNQREVAKYEPIQVQECRAFLRRMLDAPDDLAQHVRQIFTAIILKAVYDMDIKGLDDEYLLLAQEAVLGTIQSRLPGTYWIEFFPFFKHIPSWVPGAKFKQAAEHYRPYVEAMRNKPFDVVKQAVANGSASPSIAASLIKKIEERYKGTNLESQQEEIARNVTGIAFAAGADTTTAAAQTFLIAMSLFPDVQRNAQAELDRVVSDNRLPDFGDHDKLIYVQAVTLESMRWLTTFPLGLPHRVSCDDVYKGFLIPKGTIVTANAWAMLHNPEDYPDPDQFKPERFIKNGQLDPNVRNPLTIAFGFGRRICAGRHLSNGSLFLAIASILHTFNISPILDDNGEPFDPLVSMSTSVISVPDSVPCTLTPRSSKAERLIREWCMTNEREC